MKTDRKRIQANHIYKKEGEIHIKCILSDNGDQLEFYCPYCKIMHRHGNCEGSRVPHCDYFKDEYVLVRDKCIDKEKNLYETEIIRTKRKKPNYKHNSNLDIHYKISENLRELRGCLAYNYNNLKEDIKWTKTNERKYLNLYEISTLISKIRFNSEKLLKQEKEKLSDDEFRNFYYHKGCDFRDTKWGCRAK